MKITERFAMLAAAAALLAALPTAQAQVVQAQPVLGEKLDSGLGQLPPYAQWDDKSGQQPVRLRVAGESIDSGLGELPPYSRWLDRTGRDPMGRGELRAGLKSR